MAVTSFNLGRTGIANMIVRGTGRLMLIGDSVTNANNNVGNTATNGQSSLFWGLLRTLRPAKGWECVLAQAGSSLYPTFQRTYPTGTGYSQSNFNNLRSNLAQRTTLTGTTTQFAMSDFWCCDCFTGAAAYTAGTNLWQDAMNLDTAYGQFYPGRWVPGVYESFTTQLLYLQHTEGLKAVNIGIGRNGSVSQSTANFDMDGATAIKLSAAPTAVAANGTQYGFARLVRTAVPDVTNRQACILGNLWRYGGRTQGNGLGLIAFGTGGALYDDWWSPDAGDLTPNAGSGIYLTDARLTEYLALLTPDVIVIPLGYNDAADTAGFQQDVSDLIDRFETCGQAASLTNLKYLLVGQYACTSISLATAQGAAARMLAVARAGTVNVNSNRIAFAGTPFVLNQVFASGAGVNLVDTVHPRQLCANFVCKRTIRDQCEAVVGSARRWL